ncbi:uncharacterized protein [Dermacentor albipictus]|uniref:uncharacterized protein n=1 Tax=Dermacentor albipictus TaxID=60249 RepID=UPI0031FD5162
MLAKAAVVLILLQTAACQRPEDNKKPKSHQWKNFLRDWHILMKHVFTPEEEESLLRCCAPNKTEALKACINEAGLTFVQYKQIKSAVRKWRSSKIKNGRPSPEVEEKDLSEIADSKTSLRELVEKARTLGKCIAKIK